MSTLEVNNTEIHFERSGTGEPLVLVHGSWVDCRVWDAVLPRFRRSFDVVAYDRRGHSRSSRPSGQGSIHEDVDDLAGLIELLGLAPAHVAGTSGGGSITLRLGATRPELVRGVAVHDPPLFDLLAGETERWPQLTELRAHLDTVAALLESGQLEPAARHYVDHVAGSPGGWAALDPSYRQLLVANAPTYLDQSRDPAVMDIEVEELGAFGGPVLVTYGDRRPPFFRRIAELIVAAMPGARAAPFPGAAHDPQVTHPDAYAATVGSFCATASSALLRAESS
jgi:pimeloyl-ACP methyl ester carboxylesterase